MCPWCFYVQCFLQIFPSPSAGALSQHNVLASITSLLGPLSTELQTQPVCPCCWGSHHTPCPALALFEGCAASGEPGWDLRFGDQQGKSFSCTVWFWLC